MTDSDHTPSPTHCISCGTEVPDHAKFCQACGSAVYRPEDKSEPPEPAPAESPVPEASEVPLTFAVAQDPAGFAELLQEMKLRAAMTVPELAARMGVAPNAVHQYFYRKRGVGGTSTIRWFLRYAEACGCAVTLTFPLSERRGRTAVMTYGTDAE